MLFTYHRPVIQATTVYPTRWHIFGWEKPCYWTDCWFTNLPTHWLTGVQFTKNMLENIYKKIKYIFLITLTWQSTTQKSWIFLSVWSKLDIFAIQSLADKAVQISTVAATTGKNPISLIYVSQVISLNANLAIRLAKFVSNASGTT